MSAVVAWAAMGGYAVFVWPAYGIAALVLGGLSLSSWVRHRRSAAALARLDERRP
ncbi:MAG TPA: heme exporter protein CcmD [Stellaceae bacterium]|jgi:heme exporter protein D|nr:heme exporter protein CcmD [Stellaceae bacterium]